MWEFSYTQPKNVEKPQIYEIMLFKYALVQEIVVSKSLALYIPTDIEFAFMK